MNKLFSCLFLSILICCLTGCSDDMVEKIHLDQEYVPVHFNLKFNDIEDGIRTRSLAPGYTYADGSSVSVLKCYVYNKSNGMSAPPSDIVDIEVKNIDSNKGGEITLLLPKGEYFDVVFLGTSIEQTNSSSKLFFNTSNRTLNIDYSKVSCNDEELDCFFASKSGITTESILDETVELKRPFAQLNIGTKDYNEYNSSTPIKDIAVSIDGIYNTVNLMTGQVVEQPVSVSLNGSAVPSGQLFPVDGYTYLSMNYLLVDVRKLVSLSFTINHVNSSTPAKTVNIGNVAVERNYQTNVYGKALLTEDIPTE